MSGRRTLGRRAHAIIARISAPLLRVFSHSIWARDSVSAKDERIAGLLRVGYPWTDVALILFGLGAARYGVPALRDVFTDAYAQGWGVAIAAVSFVCLIGVAFPARFWRVELAGKALLVGLLVTYAGAIMSAGFIAEPDDFGRSSVAWMPIALIGPIGWRCFDIPRDARRNGWIKPRRSKT